MKLWLVEAVIKDSKETVQIDARNMTKTSYLQSSLLASHVATDVDWQVCSIGCFFLACSLLFGLPHKLPANVQELWTNTCDIQSLSWPKLCVYIWIIHYIFEFVYMSCTLKAFLYLKYCNNAVQTWTPCLIFNRQSTLDMLRFRNKLYK